MADFEIIDLFLRESVDHAWGCSEHFKNALFSILPYNNDHDPLRCQSNLYNVCMSNTMGATCGAHENTPSYCWGSCCSVFSFLCCFLCSFIFLFVFFIFSHGVVSSFSIYEFISSSGIFCPSFITRKATQYRGTPINTWVNIWSIQKQLA